MMKKMKGQGRDQLSSRKNKIIWDFDEEQVEINIDTCLRLLQPVPETISNNRSQRHWFSKQIPDYATPVGSASPVVAVGSHFAVIEREKKRFRRWNSLVQVICGLFCFYLV